MFNPTKITFLICAIISLSSCATQNMFQNQDPVPAAKDDSLFFKSQGDYQYTIRKDDKLNLSIWDNDDLSVGSIFGIYNSDQGYGKWVMVDSKGMITVPKIGEIKVEGLTVTAAKDSLVKAYARWIVKPIIDIKVLNKEVTVIGDLRAPGKVALEKDNNTLIELIGKAGDMDFYADKSKVKVIRMVDNDPKYITVDLTKMDNYYAKNIQIHPGDVIYVPSKKGKEWDKRAGASIIPATAVITSIILIASLFK